MRKLLKLLAMSSVMMSVFFTMGCGSDEEEPSPIIKEDASEPLLGLDGNTYRNPQYVFKVSNLPVEDEDWTVLVESNPEDKVKINTWLADEVAFPRALISTEAECFC